MNLNFNNPFLVDIGQEAVQVGALNWKLQPFWPDAPVAWFGAAEAQFHLRRVYAEADRFCLVAAALDKESLKKVVHLVSSPHPVHPYTSLKEALLVSHQLTDFQRVELLLAMPALGGRRPSELLADMLEICPPGQQDNIFFAGLFLQRLPREIRVLLTHEDHSDLRHLAAHADRLVAFSGPQQCEMVASTQGAESDELVAAVKKQQQQQQGGKKGNKKKFAKQHKEDRQPTPSQLAAQAAGLCYYHWMFGDRARDCRAPCSWQSAGN